MEIVIALAGAIAVAFGSLAQKPSAPDGVRLTLADGSVSFVAPPGFSRLTAAELAKHFPRDGSPANVVADPARQTTIAYELQEGQVPSRNLEEGRRAFTKDLDQSVQPKWITNEVRRIGSRDWVVLEFTESISGQPLRHIFLVSVHRERALIFDFSTPVKDFPRMEPQLRATIASIAVKH